MAVCRAAAARDRSGNQTGVSGAGLQLRINYERPRLVLKRIDDLYKGPIPPKADCASSNRQHAPPHGGEMAGLGQSRRSDPSPGTSAPTRKPGTTTPAQMGR